MSGSEAAALISASHTNPSLLEALRHINTCVDATLSRLWTWERTSRPLLKTRSTSVEVASIEIKSTSNLENKDLKFTYQEWTSNCMPFATSEDTLHASLPTREGGP